MRTNLLQRLVLLLLSSLIAGQEDPAASLRRQTQVISPLEEGNRIIGGIPAEDGEFPFYVKFEGGVLCGGTLISPNRVLTAGHCIKNYGWPSSVRIGPTNGNNGQVVRVKCGIVHPGYLNPFLTVVADVAVLKLETDVIFETSNATNTTTTTNATNPTTTANDTSTTAPSSSPTQTPTASPTQTPTARPSSSPTQSPTASPTQPPTASPTASPTQTPTQSPTASPNANFVQLNRDVNYPAVNRTDLTVIGFGKTSNGGSTSGELRKVGTFFVPREDCVETYNDAIVRPEAHICADVPNKGDCNGDSGGPLMDENKVQVGIVSFGYGGCASEYQDVYAKVSSYVDWIDAQMTDETCPDPPDPNSGGSNCNFFKSVGYYVDYGMQRVTGFVKRVFIKN